MPAPVNDRAVIHAEATGFTEAFPVARVTTGQVTTIGVKLLPIGATTAVPVANGGTGTRAWSVVSGALPTGLILNPSTGQISGAPTTQGTSTFTVLVQDSGNPPQSDQRPFSLTINPVSGGGSGGGTLTVTNAPASVGGTFNGSVTSQSIGGVSWTEQTNSQTFVHSEAFTVVFYNLPGLTYQLIFNYAHAGGGTSAGEGWTCAVPALPGVTTCSGVTINQAGGTLTLANTVLSALSGFGSAPLITLNGTLTFTPF